MSQAAATVTLIQAGSAREIFNRQRAAWLDNPFLPLAERRHTLMALETLLVDNQEEIAEVICRDFGNRSPHETKLFEIFPTVSGLADARRRLKRWVMPQQRHVSFWSNFQSCARFSNRLLCRPVRSCSRLTGKPLKESIG